MSWISAGVETALRETRKMRAGILKIDLALRLANIGVRVTISVLEWVEVLKYVDFLQLLANFLDYL